jgi:hypothetical protein
MLELQNHQHESLVIVVAIVVKKYNSHFINRIEKPKMCCCDS